MRFHRVLMQKKEEGTSGKMAGKIKGREGWGPHKREIAWGLSSSDSKIRMGVLAHVEGKKALAFIAKKSPYVDLAKEAVMRIGKNDGLLQEIAEEGENMPARIEAALGIKDEARLRDMALNTNLPLPVRKAAVQTIGMEGGSWGILLQICRECPDAEVGLEAVRMADDNGRYARLALNLMSQEAKCKEVRIAAGRRAVEGVGGVFLVEILNGAKDVEVGEIAIGKIVGMDALEMIARAEDLPRETIIEGKNFCSGPGIEACGAIPKPTLQLQALGKLIEPDRLRRVMRNSKEQMVVEAAAKKLAAHDGVLGGCILSAKEASPWVKIALANIHDISVLEGIEKCTIPTSVREAVQARKRELENFEQELFHALQ